MLTSFMIIIHSLVDFVLQTKEMVEDKSKMKLVVHVKHGAWHMISFIFLVIIVRFKSLPLLIIVGIALSHIVIDILKEIANKIIKKYQKEKLNKKVWEVLIFLIDQILHLVIIILLTKNVHLNYNALNLSLLNSGIKVDEIMIRNIAIITYISLSGAYFIPLMLDLVYMNIPDYSSKLDGIIKSSIKKEGEHQTEDKEAFIDEVKTGKWIGILERMLIGMFIVSNQISSIGFIIAVKSLARFKMMDNKIFSEYYLLGTLFSVVYSFGCYYFLNSIL